MSGTFNELNVPPTLVSFAVDVASDKTIISPELKKAGNGLMLFQIEKDAYEMPVYEQIKELYAYIHEAIKAGDIVSAYVVERKGIAEAVSKMAFGNGLGVQLESNALEAADLFAPGWGNLVCEVPVAAIEKLAAKGSFIGNVIAEPVLSYGATVIRLEDAVNAWNEPLEKVFPTNSGAETEPAKSQLFDTSEVVICKHKVAKPKVFIPVFPGTNCEYDSAKAFELAGAEVMTRVFRNMTAEGIRESVDEFVTCIQDAQIIMFPGGFSAGDEPEGSAKFFATVFRNEKVKEAVEVMLKEKDGLMLGICNGFQALIKLGLVPYGTITTQQPDSPTLTYNTIGRHVSKMVYTKVVTNKSPWLAGAQLGGVYCTPASHGEGRFVASREWIDKLMANGQIATQYTDVDGTVSMEEYWNPNGSYCAIEGITSPDGRILGKMAHVERRGKSVAVNIYGEQDLKIFESGVAYFK